jgi:hypothetical protein
MQCIWKICNLMDPCEKAQNLAKTKKQFDNHVAFLDV